MGEWGSWEVGVEGGRFSGNPVSGADSECNREVTGKEAESGGYPDYPLFKGLQRPLELMGLQGRYIYWAAGVAGGAIVGFIAAYCLMGFVAGLVVLATVLSAGIVLIILKQRKGLHSKNVKRGVYVYAYSHKV